MTGSAPFWLRFRAPFAAYRWMQAGSFRGTMPVMPPTAARGLVLNLAAIETRGPLAGTTTSERPDAPRLEIAVGLVTQPETASLFQQLHSYLIGRPSKKLQEGTRGAKYHIAPVRREILVGLDGVIGVRGHEPGLRERVEAGLAGSLDASRYGLPFAGDNNLLFDTIEVVAKPPAARWFERMQPDDAPRRGSWRLTARIDRTSSLGTSLLLFAPSDHASEEPSPEAWTWTPTAPE